MQFAFEFILCRQYLLAYGIDPVEFQCPTSLISGVMAISGGLFLLDVPADPTEIPRKQPATGNAVQRRKKSHREIYSILCMSCSCVGFLFNYLIDLNFTFVK
jgi:hypothetical protein